MVKEGNPKMKLGTNEKYLEGFDSQCNEGSE